MMTLGGQTFASAYAAVETAMGCVQSAGACGANGVPTVAAQPFFEAALSGTGYCNGFANCTAAVASKQFGNFSLQKVWTLWSALDKGGLGGGPTCPVATGCTTASGPTAAQNQQTTLPGLSCHRPILTNTTP